LDVDGLLFLVGCGLFGNRLRRLRRRLVMRGRRLVMGVRQPRKQSLDREWLGRTGCGSVTPMAARLRESSCGELLGARGIIGVR